MKTLILKRTGYTVKGISDLTPWGGGNACIVMDSFNVNKIDNKTLKENINDGQFGVQSINGAICDIYENFEGTLKFLKTVKVGKITKHTEEYYNDNIFQI